MQKIFSTLAISFLLAGAAIAQKSPVTSIFAEPLSLESIGAIKNVEASAPNLLHQAPDGHLIITGANTEVGCPQGSYIELIPKMAIPGFSMVALAVFEDGQRMQSFGLEQTSGMPMVRIDPPAGQVNRKRVQIVLYDAQSHAHIIQQCIIRRHVSLGAPAITTSLQSELCLIKSGNSIVDFSLNGRYLGKLVDTGQPAILDARRLPVGHYVLESYPREADGVLMPPVKNEFDITPRYTLALNHDASPIHLGSPLDSDTVKLSVSVHSAAHIDKTLVYVNGDLISEYTKPDFTATIPIKNIPSGKTTFDVIGVAADGTHYAVEAYPVEIKNDPWETETYSTTNYALLCAKLSEIAEDKSLMQTWFEKFSHTPLTTKTGEHWHDELVRNTTNSGSTWQRFFNDIYTPTEALAYKRNADKYLLLLTHAYLEAGHLYKKLKMRQEARRAFQSVIALVGNANADGQQAKIELHEIAIPL